MTYKQGVISYDMRTKVFWFLVATLVALISVQIISIGSTTKNVAERQRLEKVVLDATARAGELEFAYIELKNTVGIEMASNLGFKEVKAPSYVSRVSPDSLGTLTFNR